METHYSRNQVQSYHLYHFTTQGHLFNLLKLMMKYLLVNRPIGGLADGPVLETGKQ